LHEELVAGSYGPEQYEAFYVKDPKLRHIHKASVRDRVLHQAIFRVLYPIFDKHFIFDSYSSRDFKGTHAGSRRVGDFIRKASANWTRQTLALKCDVRRFFDSIDHEILLTLIRKEISDEKAMNLIEIIIRGFEKSTGKGLPLGNVTSQLFANIYMNELDQFIKHVLKATCYARYCDDFVIIHREERVLVGHVSEIRRFLSERLKLELHPNKVSVQKARQGVDFLGHVILPHRKVLRTKTKRRMLKRLSRKNITSYLGMLSHCKGKTIERRIKSTYDTMMPNEDVYPNSRT
jgi:retron-type reverse transcriptase